IVVGGAVAAAYGILQHFTGADWYRTLLGRPTYVYPREPGTPGYAVVGFFRSYLTFAHVMIFPLAWALAGALAGRAAALGAALLVVLALVFSPGRGARTAAPAYYAAYPAADRRSHAHNNFLQMAAEAGLAGLAAFGLVYATVLRRGAETIERAPDGATWAAAAGAWAGVVGFLVGGLTQYTFGDADVAAAMWGALASLGRLGEAD